jgi:hypothetical protein
MRIRDIDFLIFLGFFIVLAFGILSTVGNYRHARLTGEAKLSGSLSIHV